MTEKLKLFEITYKGNHNRSLSDRVEYIRHTDGAMLKKQMEDVCLFNTSEYYGYTSVTVKEVDINAFPEIRTVNIEFDKQSDKVTSEMDPESKAMYDIIMPYISREKLRGVPQLQIESDIRKIIQTSLGVVYN